MKSLKVHIFILFLFIVSFTVKAQTVFKDVTEEAGIDHVFQVFEGTFGGGAVIFDINNDGFEDIFITSGMAEDALYLNNGDGTFKNIYKGSGLEISKGYVTQGAASADVNRDGFRDLYITTINTTDGTQKIPRARNLLFLNNGELTFQDVTAAFGLDDMNSFSTGPSFGDVNADGYPDLYVGNYFQNFEGKLGIIKDATIVSANQTAQGYLLINRDGKKFENVYDDYGLGHRGFGFGGVFTDYDNDGDQDLYVNHDFGFKAVPNLLYENQYPRKQFKSVGKEKGMDLKINAMASAVGDYDNNGYMDYYVTNIKFNRFMVNQGKDQPFIDLSKELSTYFLAISWGANFADFDLDGDLDLYVSNGDLNPNCVPMGNFYFENKNGAFIDMARVTKTNDYGVGRGTVVFDYDNDGDLDILLVNQQAIYEYPVESKTKLFRNDTPSGNWIKVALEGVSAEKNGIGSRVTLVSGNTRMIREIDGGGSSHISQNSTIAHFGLGKYRMVDSLIVTWTGGKKQWILNPTLNTLITIVESPDEPNYWAYAILGTSLVLSLMFLYFRRKKVA